MGEFVSSMEKAVFDSGSAQPLTAETVGRTFFEESEHPKANDIVRAPVSFDGFSLEWLEGALSIKTEERQGIVTITRLNIGGRRIRFRELKGRMEIVERRVKKIPPGQYTYRVSEEDWKASRDRAVEVGQKILQRFLDAGGGEGQDVVIDYRSEGKRVPICEGVLGLLVERGVASGITVNSRVILLKNLNVIVHAIRGNKALREAYSRSVANAGEEV